MFSKISVGDYTVVNRLRIVPLYGYVFILQADYIKQLISADPGTRPSTQDLLQGELFHTKQQVLIVKHFNDSFCKFCSTNLQREISLIKENMFKNCHCSDLLSETNIVNFTFFKYIDILSSVCVCIYIYI